MSRRRAQDGQSAVELVALVPAIVLLALAGWQIAVAAHAWTLAQGSARAAARAHEVGAPVSRAALAVLPAGYARRARVDTPGGDRVRVRLPVPRVLPFGPAPGHVAAEARLDGAVP
jgi:hypothetical protein